MKATRILSLIAILLLIPVFIIGIENAFVPILLILLLLAGATLINKRYRSYSLAFFILSAVVISLYYPDTCTSYGGFQFSKLIVPVLMIIMFGMGASMKVSDFIAVIKMPKAVVIGLICQFSIMPLVGYSLAKLSDFPPEIAAGIVLVGCSPSGLASNVMSFIAKANLALSLTLTVFATLLAPILTPLLMKGLAESYISINFVSMLWSIVKIVIIPVVAGVIYSCLIDQRFKLMNEVLPLLSMVGIVVIIAIITALGRDALIEIGLILIIIVIAHNILGYFLGFSISKLAGLDRASCRTIAFEVGMQNSGLASGIAVEVGKIATMGLAPAAFSPFMNITGSVLASIWRPSAENQKPIN